MNTVTSKNYTPTFQAYYKSPFSKKLEKYLETGKGADELVDSFSKVFKLKEKNVIGAGAYGKVSKIDDYYVFKTFYSEEPKVGEIKVNSAHKFSDIKSYFGEYVAKFGNIPIMRNASADKRKYTLLARSNNQGATAYNYSLREFLSLPQRAFDTLAREFQKLNEIHDANLYYRFDTNNPNNFIKVGNSIRIVDEVDWVPCSEPNDIFSFLRIFIQHGGDKNFKKEILKKCLLASEKCQLPMSAAFEYMPSLLDDILKNAKVDRPFGAIYETLMDLRQAGLSENVRMQKVREYLDTL